MCQKYDERVPVCAVTVPFPQVSDLGRRIAEEYPMGAGVTVNG